VNRSQRLQRLAVRMLYDEGFRARVLNGEEPVDAADHALVAAVDPRAWSTDPYRSGRTLTAILAELPVTGALLGAPRALQFFRSDAFHAAIDERGSLVLSFGGWADVGPVGALELAIAHLRRAVGTSPSNGRGESRSSSPSTGGGGGREATGGGGLLALGDRFHPIAVPAGTLAAYEALRQSLGSDPVAAIGAEPLAAPALAEGEEHLLVERSPDGSIAIGTIGESLYALLAPLLSGPSTERDVIATLRALGAGDAAEEILAGLVADGVLVSGS
jgi:hypothetical protein